MKKYKKSIFLYLFIILSCLGIGYAFLRTELQINGTANFHNARWDIHFANLVVNPDSVELSTGNSAASISASTTEVTYAVTLKEPGDFYEFTVDAVNAGTIDAMIDTISSKMGGVEITTLPNYMEYSVTYSDGVALAPNQYLKAGTTETYKVHIGFKKEINASDLTGQVENKTLSFSVTYVQADDNAVKKPSPFENDDWNTVINTLKTGDISPYKVGDEKEVDLGTLGVHKLRIANSTTPAECSTVGFSQTACGIVLEFADIIIPGSMNSTYTNVGGWPVSSMRNYVNNDIYNALPTIVKNAIIDTTVVSGHGPTAEEVNFTSTDKLYLLSTHEVWEDIDGYGGDGPDYYDTAYHNTRQLDYYANLGVTMGAYNSSTSSYDGNYSGAIKKKGTSNEWWWLRSAYFGDYTTSFIRVDEYGCDDFASADNYGGISPAFRIA